MSDKLTDSHAQTRLMAFAFARADLLIEIDRTATITFASGSSRWATGKSDSELIGSKLPAYIPSESQSVLREIQKAFQSGQRLTPQVILFKNNSKIVTASISGCPLPESPNTYAITIAHPVSTDSAIISNGKRVEATGLLDKKSFESKAKQKIEQAKDKGENLEMTMIDLSELTQIKQNLNDEAADTMMKGIGLILKKQSVDGDFATQIDDTKFSILHDSNVTTQDIKNELTTFVKKVDPEVKEINILAQALSLDVSMLEDEDAGRALVYAMNKFASSQKGEFSLTTLSSGLKELIADTVKKVTDFKETLASRGFTLHFQPIVDLRTREVKHQEALTRLPDGSSPFQMVTFAEEVGLVTELDHAVCRQALDLLSSDTNICDIAINISGRSLQSEIFVAALFELLRSKPNVRERIKIEITESSRIEKLEAVANIVKKLQAENHKVCLDDFGSGSATLHYLRMLPVDVVKVDGIFVKDIARNKRDLAMVRSIGSMCNELGMQTVAEFVEDDEQIKYLVECKIQKGQGYLFGKPRAIPYVVASVPINNSNRTGKWVEWR